MSRLRCEIVTIGDVGSFSASQYCFCFAGAS